MGRMAKVVEAVPEGLLKVGDMERLAKGLEVPMPKYPPFVTTKCVAVDEPMANSGPVTPFGLTESKAHGVFVAMPIKFPFVIVRAEMLEVAYVVLDDVAR